MSDNNGGKILTIETGYSCNAFCGFCPQVEFRKRSMGRQEVFDLTTAEIRERIKRGAEDGYTQLGFSGGEPTIRDDFIELVEYGKEHGFRLIALTTNGARLAHLKYTKNLIEAGLTNINISIHGSCAKTHNSMMRMPHSFEHAIKGLQNVRKVSSVLNKRIDLMSMCLGAPQVLKEFPEHIRLMGELGIRLHMIQPFIMNQVNSNFAARVMSPYGALTSAIRAGSEIAKGHGGHIKLFNTPICLLRDIDENLERQARPLDVLKTHNNVANNVSNQWSSHGYYRVDECETCDEPCNGFRVEYYPQQEMLETIKEAVRSDLRLQKREEMWISGLEYLTADSMENLTKFVKKQGVRRLTVVTSGYGRAQSSQFSAGALQNIDEVAFILKRETHGQQMDLTKFGNFENIRAILSAIRGHKKTLTSAIVTEYSVDDVKNPEVVEFVTTEPFNIVRASYRFSFRNWLSLVGRGSRVKLVERLRSAGKRVILDRPSYIFQGKGIEFDSSPRKLLEHPWMNNPNPEILKLPDLFWFFKQWRKTIAILSAGVVTTAIGLLLASFWSRWLVMPSVVAGFLVIAGGCYWGANELSPQTRIEGAHNTRPKKYVLWGTVPD
jgi:pyruvate-formate lyase-activating enzyme